jgi:Xaa-Pro aminopeptidase
MALEKSYRSSLGFTMIAIDKAQAYMQTASIDAWLVYDFRGSNPVMWDLLGYEKKTTRRAFLFIPAWGEPRILASVIEPHVFAQSGCAMETYASRQNLSEKLAAHLAGCRRVAMEYSPGAALPILSWVDGGTLEMVRACGVKVVSSADLFQLALATWSAAALESHYSAAAAVVQVKDGAFKFIRDHLARGTSTNEYAVQDYIVEEFERRSLDMDHRPIVGVNRNSGNPHYEPLKDHSAAIGKGDWVLIDLWARCPGREHIFGDITWVGFAGSEVPQEHRAVFDVVKEARDRVVEALQTAWEKGEQIAGWQMDQVARQVITAAGYGDYFLHRTGHSLGPGSSVHGLGANLDDFETHDTRALLPATGFTIEPGIYLPHFGVRLEINVYMDPETGPTVTTPCQNDVVCLV